MEVQELLFNSLESSCGHIHHARLMAVLDVSHALQRSNHLALSAIGRKLLGPSSIKHKIKKVDRLEGNTHLHKELNALYAGLSDFIFKYVSHDKRTPLIVDLCFVKDDRAIQMLSAEVATKGRSLPLYREVFHEGGLADRAEAFLNNVHQCLPEGREVVIVMDAGFYEKWFKAIESHGWYWLCRARKGKTMKLSEESDWISIKDFIHGIGNKTTAYNTATLTKRHQHACRIITTRRSPKGRKATVSRGKTTSTFASGSYSAAAKEPWILTTNLPLSYKAAQIVHLYSKRMQIEESFRDLKSRQFGLGGRDIRTRCVHRWSVKMLLAAIVQITYWIIGIIGHSQGMQKYFQSNTVKNRKVFSYFTLGKLIIEHKQFNMICNNERTLADIIEQELAREW